MNRKILKGFTAIIMFLITAAVCTGKYSGGSGNPNDPYQIANVTDLLTLAADANDYNKCFIVTADINLQGQSFSSAVISINGSPPFTGQFDGNNNTISHLTINGTGNHYLGLFGLINTGAQIKNLVLTDCDINGSNSEYHAGGLAGVNKGAISNCYSTGSVHGFDYLGGLVGYNSGGAISDCCSTSIIHGTSYLGGLVGSNDSGVISYCSAISDVNGNQSIGGLLGYNSNNHASITYCHSSGSVAGMQYVGGLVGSNFTNCNISHCYSTAAVIGTSGSYAVGGLVGGSQYGNMNGYCITNCYSTGPVTGYNYIGGLVGQNRYGGDANCYSLSSVNGLYNSQYVAGLVGYDEGSPISNCFSSGPVNALAGSQNIAGLVAYITNDGNVSGSFWDIQTSGQATSAGGTGKTTAEMKTLSTFTSAGWDFVQTWNIAENQTYPFFRISPAGDINNDGKVDFYDFAVLASQWLE